MRASASPGERKAAPKSRVSPECEEPSYAGKVGLSSPMDMGMQLDLSSSDHLASLVSGERNTTTDEVVVPSASAPRVLSGDVEADASTRPRLVWLAYMLLAFGVICTALTTAYITATSEARDVGQFRAVVDRMQEV